MRKTQTINEQHDTIITNTNGTTTWTSQVLRHPIKAYDTFLDNGVNKELMEDVMDSIKASPTLWDQGSWRSIEIWDPQEPTGDYHLVAQEVKALLAFNTDVAELEVKPPVCGTSMCMAGWASELSGADWVVDGTVMKMITKDEMSVTSNVSELSELVWVPRGWFMDRVDHDKSSLDYGNTWNGTADYTSAYFWDELGEELQIISAKRGFSVASHAVINVSTYAKMALGICSDPLRMFDGSNSVKMLSKCADYYIAHGADYSQSRGSVIRRTLENQLYDEALAATPSDTVTYAVNDGTSTRNGASL
jgi:hypothetical protein